MRGTNRDATALERSLRNTGRLAKRQRLVLGTESEVSFETHGFYKTEVRSRSGEVKSLGEDTTPADFVFALR